MFCVKKYRSSIGLIVAICERELVGQTLYYGNETLVVSEAFYCEEIIESEDELIAIMNEAISLNLLGNRVVFLAMKLGLVHKDAIVYLRHNEETVAYAIVQVMRF